MKNKEVRNLNDSLEPLKIHQLEERLEVSSMMPSGDVVEGNNMTFTLTATPALTSSINAIVAFELTR